MKYFSHVISLFTKQRRFKLQTVVIRIQFVSTQKQSLKRRTHVYTCINTHTRITHIRSLRIRKYKFSRKSHMHYSNYITMIIMEKVYPRKFPCVESLMA